MLYVEVVLLKKYIFFTYLFLLPAFLYGERSIQTFKVRAVVPTVFTMQVPGMSAQGVKVVEGQIDQIDDQNSETILLIPDAIYIRDLMSNSPIYLQMRVLSWTAPAPLNAYTTPTSPLHSFQLMVRPPYRAGGELSPVAPYSSFSELGTSSVDILKIGDIRSSGAHVGVRGGSVDMDARLVFEPGQAVPGNYSVELEITVREQP